MTCALYRHFDANGELLYVGVTNNPKRRLSEHKCRSVWGGQIADVTVKWMRSRAEALSEEKLAILVEAPVFNGGDRSFVRTGDVLHDWMADACVNQTDIAKYLGVSQSAVSKMISRAKHISLSNAARIEDLSEGAVPMRYWVSGPLSVDAGTPQKAAP